MPGIIGVGSTIAAGIRDDFRQTYEQEFDGVMQAIEDAMLLDVPFAHRTETFGMHETIPYPERFDEGNESIPEESTGHKSFSVTVYDYGMRISWRIKDREDNKVGDLRAKGQILGRHFASLDSRILVELQTGTASLLPAIPNAPDGAAPFATTDGAGSNRFGVSGGNVVSGNGVADEGSIETDFFAAISRMGQFQDTKGEPYWNPSLTQERYTVYFNIANLRLFTKAFAATTVHSVQDSTGAAVSNAILASGVQVRLIGSQRYTDNDWFVHRGDAPIRPFFRGTRRPLFMAEATSENSDRARDIGKEYVQFTCRHAYGVNVPFAAVKVNN